MDKRKYGLIGYPLSHSFSGKYFAEKFRKEKIEDAQYDLYELNKIADVAQLFDEKKLLGFNVTIPYKQEIKAWLDHLDDSAVKVGAVNVVKISSDGYRTGFNSDYYGFKNSLLAHYHPEIHRKALLLGTGGAAMAVEAVFKDLNISYLRISRDENKGDVTYDALAKKPELLDEYLLIINTTPLGTWPQIEAKAPIPYFKLGSRHFLYDLVYNPEETAFMNAGKERGALVKNGYEMLVLQAEKSWEIWNAT
ncbi:MAG: shikimate dehydrogenase [Cyclobacteriaceae bacterium]|nr:shikimate dehydrogenase [Cyclobacteriaceae bacterium]